MARRKKIKITTSLIAAVASVMTFFACIVLIVCYIRFARRTEATLAALSDDIDATRTELESARSSLEMHIDNFERSVSEEFASRRANARIRQECHHASQKYAGAI